jgi:hypothetical protein
MFLQDNWLCGSVIFMFEEAWRRNVLASDRSV